MGTLRVRAIVDKHLDKAGRLSMLADVFGVYGSNPQARSLRTQLDLIQTMPFVRVALVTINGASPQLQRDLDNANTVYQTEVGVWVYCSGSIVVNRPDLQTLNQTDCLGGSDHEVSAEEIDLFVLGRDLGAFIVCYYIMNSTAMLAGQTFGGCAAHPPGLRGFWVGDGADDWTFVHELSHVLGLNHVCDPTRQNLMIGTLLDDDGDPISTSVCPTGTFNILQLPPDLSSFQAAIIRLDLAMVSSINA